MFLRFFFQAEDGIRDLVRSRGLGDVYKRQALHHDEALAADRGVEVRLGEEGGEQGQRLLVLLLSLIHI